MVRNGPEQFGGFASEAYGLEILAQGLNILIVNCKCHIRIASTEGIDKAFYNR